MSYTPDRRTAIEAGLRWMALLAGYAGPVHVQPLWAEDPRQNNWRFCHKCQVMFFDGYPTKGTCAAGGAHEAAGYNFNLTHDVAESGTGQKNWRYCAKCEAMFFDGYPDKGRCPNGGGHQASGLNFVLTHGLPESPTSQKNWRYCGKCHAVFFDGFPTKGVCASGGTHQAAGLNFVLHHQTDYPAKVDLLSRQNSPLQDVFKIMWNEAGRPIVADKVQQAVNGRSFARGVSGYQAHARIGDIAVSQRALGPNRLSVQLNATGNDCEFHATTPTVFGKYADPAFRVGFGLALSIDMGVRNAKPPIDINVFDARTTNASVHGSNAVGTLVETVADFFTKGEFSRNITSRINGDLNLRSQIAQSIGSALDRVW